MISQVQDDKREVNVSFYVLTPSYYFSHTQTRSISSLFSSELSILSMYHPFKFPPDYTRYKAQVSSILSDPPTTPLPVPVPTPFFPFIQYKGQIKLDKDSLKQDEG